ncbi:GIY-YIG nuclease family protein [Hymenobacter negativus]|uniref:GIY-YIG nuclease family protein n=1 Tax=Hymenobacter negativus TaxID=2795026 RepID=A0ABS3QBD1_9BACT|nr:GIY-YIG nuclease family protein [Hymenobacter negativus]MBO2008421.1 GIY-YIG nuclease family protein [Hymenobacter negativus]
MYVYILTNQTQTTLYIGVTNDLTRRLYEHSTGRGDAEKFTGRYQIDLLVYFETLPDATQAIAREKQLKGWTRRKKDALITAFNPTWKAIDLNNWEG